MSMAATGAISGEDIHTVTLPVNDITYVDKISSNTQLGANHPKNRLLQVVCFSSVTCLLHEPHTFAPSITPSVSQQSFDTLLTYPIVSSHTKHGRHTLSHPPTHSCNASWLYRRESRSHGPPPGTYFSLCSITIKPAPTSRNNYQEPGVLDLRPRYSGTWHLPARFSHDVLCAAALTDPRAHWHICRSGEYGQPFSCIRSLPQVRICGVLNGRQPDPGTDGFQWS